jgi:hypothetical protein
VNSLGEFRRKVNWFTTRAEVGALSGYMDAFIPEGRGHAELAREQYQLVSRRQLLADGLSPSWIKRQTKSGALEAVLPGIYTVGPADGSYWQRVRAACLSFEDGAVACRLTAARLHRFPGIRTNEIELLTDRSRFRRQHSFVLHRTNYLPDSDVTILRGIPTTTASRTLLDIGSIVGPKALGTIVDDGLTHRSFTLAVVHDQLRRSAAMGRPGTTALREVLTRYDPGRPHEESHLERAMLEALAKYGFPEPVKQLPVWDEGTFVGRLDAAYPDSRIGLEADGYEFHSARGDWLRDRRRQNALVSRAWRILRFTSEDEARPLAFLHDLARMLGRSVGL